jgi:hypothetical protein
MRLDEIEEGMKVWVIGCYGSKSWPATVLGIRFVHIENRWLRYVALLVKDHHGRQHHAISWARNLRKTSS